MKKKIYLISFAVLGVLLFIDLLFPDHGHTHFIWHTWPGFDIICGLIGAMVLAKVTLGSGYLFLWRPNYSVSLSKMSQNLDRSPPFIIKEVLVKKGDHVREGQNMIKASRNDSEILVTAPMEGRIAKVFVHTANLVGPDQTLIDMTVSQNILHHEQDKGVINA